jgi:propionyl-CoA carboxylase alpha chain
MRALQETGSRACRGRGDSTLFEKILIANRGEIACRIIRSCRRLGIKTVAVYSEADAGSLAVEQADEAYLIGKAPSAESYLRIDAILDACRKSGAEAVHPGFGFLSEKAAFAEALEQAGIVFIGPPPEAMRAMGDKIASKQLALKAGVSTVPGKLEAIPDAKTAVAIAKEIGYPVMLKASAGGGGKGMRICRTDAETREAFRSASHEAQGAFGDARVFIEKYVEEPRHIEIQVLGDKHGQVIHLGERECSIQRRHQKVLEEAPSPFLDAKTRQRMGAEAVQLAKAVGYYSAGTVEFIVDRDRNFYFLEMNTRLQVEHPVTEMVTGLDLVEQMIRIAAGAKLPLAQKDVKAKGWAIEARLYAEDPARGFLPSIGRLRRYIEPPQEGGVRIDTGVVEGSEISVHYDPMIAKVIAHGADRAEATAKLRQALDAYYVRGINHNGAFLSALLAHPRFQEGRLSTNFIAEEFPEGFKADRLDAETKRTLVFAAAVMQRRAAERALHIGGQTSRPHPEFADWVVLLGRDEHPLRLKPHSSGFLVESDLGSGPVESDWAPGQALFLAQLVGAPVVVQVERQGPRWQLSHGGAAVEALVLEPRAAELYRHMPVKAPPDLSRFLLSPMPGLLVSVAVKEGQEVKAGEELAVVEAMKMENVLRALADGTVKTLHCKPGDSLAVDQASLEFE